MIATNLRVLIVLIVLWVGLAPRPATAEPQFPLAESPTAARPLSDFLNPDGALNLPSEAILGGIDPAGFQMISAPGEAPRFVQASAVPDAPPASLFFGADNANWDPRFYPPGLNNAVRALAWDGTTLYVAGDFTIADGITVNRIARWDGSSWSALGGGMDGTVWALAWDGTGLYAGGQFTTAGGTSANRIARWDGSSWSSFGFGTAGTIYALAWDGTNNHLYVGGQFTAAAGVTVNNVARWDGSSWSALGGGTSARVNTLAWDGANNRLYAGGLFTAASGVTVNHVAQWDGSSWSGLGGGVNNWVNALVWDETNNHLYAGGWFTEAAGAPALRIARWNGSSWSALGDGIANNAVNALAWDGTNLYAAGNFTPSGGVTVNRVARWDGSFWNALGGGTSDAVNALAWNGATLYAGGVFTAAGGVAASRLAGWNGANWRATSLGVGLDGAVFALAWDGTNLYAGGNFTTAGGAQANRIARWDGSNWSALGAGMNLPVRALVWDGTGLYAGGQFTQAGGTPANRIARWDGSSWNALGGGLGGVVWALAWDGTNNHLYAGGAFTSPTARIARWDGSSWIGLGDGMNQEVRALAWDGTGLYAGGWFTEAGGTPASHIARWDGSSWSALGSGTTGVIYALAWDGTNNRLYVGGEFNNAGGASALRVARWDVASANWNALGDGASDTVWSLAWNGTNLYAGGWFTGAGGTPASRIARWDGSGWNPLGAGMNINAVNALAWDGDSLYDSLYAGGEFTFAGGKPSSRLGRWRLAAIWDGGGEDNNGSTAANWSGDIVPGTTDVAIFDGTSSKDAILDDDFPATLAGIVMEESYKGAATHNRDLALTGELRLHGGVFVAADPSASSLTAGGVLHTGGVLSQTRTVNNENVAFLQIEDGSGNVTYRGVEVNSAANLGPTAVTIRAVDFGLDQYCTNDFQASPAYAARCFQIVPTHQAAAVVRLWALDSERGDIDADDLRVYRFSGGGWTQLDNPATGADGDYVYAQAETPGFPHFLLAKVDVAPTAVTLHSIIASPAAPPLVLVVSLLVLGLVTSVSLTLRQRSAAARSR